MWRKGKTQALLVRMYIGTDIVENSIRILQKIKNRATLKSSNSTSGYLPEESKNTNSKRYMYSYVHCSTIHNSQDKEATYVPIDKWIKKMWYAYTMEYFSAIKRMKLCHLQQHGWT